MKPTRSKLGKLNVQREQEIFPVQMTGPDSFTLDGQTYTGKPQTAGRIFADGERAFVAFAAPARRQPVIIAGATRRHWIKNSPWGQTTLTLSLWTQSEGNPYCNRGPRDEQASPDWDGTVYEIDTLERYYYDDALQSAPESGTPVLEDLLGYEGVVLTDTSVAAMVCLYDGTASSIVGYLLREYDATTLTLIEEWIHISGSTVGTAATCGTHRRNGYLFYDKDSDTFTIAGHDGLILCTRTNAPTPTVCAWAHTYGDTPENSSVSVAGAYALQGVLAECDLAFDAPSDCSVDCYARGETEWAHVAQVVLGDYLSGVDYVYAVGAWNPFEAVTDPLNPQNTRWAYYPGTSEWIVWLCGRAGGPWPPDEVTAAKAALVAIKAATGVTRTIQEYNAPLLKYPAYAEQQADIEAELAYKSSPHPENWVATGIGLTPWEDTGGANGWVVGRFLTTTELNSLIASEIIPPGDVLSGIDDVMVGQEMKEFGTFTDEWAPTVAADCQRLARGNEFDFFETVDFPRGVVNGTHIYIPVLHRYYLASEDANTGPAPTYSYDGYEDFAGSIVPDPSMADKNLRVFKFTAPANGGYSYPGDAENVGDRLIIRKYSSSALLATCDLTREFERIEGDKTYTDRRRPDLWEMGVQGGYLWLLASDWTDANTQRLGMILINTTSMEELDTLDLIPDTGYSWYATAGRPLLMVGTDGTGPWAEVQAWWSNGSTQKWVAQRIRYTASNLTKTDVIETASPGNLPDDYQSAVNLAISLNKQFWLDNNSLIMREE